MAISPHRILFVDEHLLAVDKLSGELTVRGEGEVGKLPLYDFLRKDHPGLRVLHRLDFETSGVVLFARSRAVHAAILKSKFAGWIKVYRTIVMGHMKRLKGTIDLPLPSRGQGEVRAVTHFRVLQQFDAAASAEATIETGRHHQVRRHFAAIGNPLILDELYGNKKYNRLFSHELHFRRFFLHAFSLTLPHPVTQQIITITAPLPEVFEEVLKRLRLN
ncbi:MAG: RluA family pseudouridine synthase [Candidatus Peregrinibacteria bacterium]